MRGLRKEGNVYLATPVVRNVPVLERTSASHVILVNMSAMDTVLRRVLQESLFHMDSVKVATVPVRNVEVPIAQTVHLVQGTCFCGMENV
jgi:hypothetical protein